MKYNRYAPHFIGLLHIFTLYTSSLYWMIHDNCIVDTLPDTYFACYRLAHDDCNCTNCILQLLQLTLIVSGLNFVYSRFCRVLCKFEFYPCPHISWFCGLDNLPSFANCRCILVLNCDPHAWVCWLESILYNKLLGNNYNKKFTFILFWFYFYSNLYILIWAVATFDYKISGLVQ